MAANGNGMEQEQVERLFDFYAFLIQGTGLVARADDIDKLYQDICRLGIQLDRHLVLACVGMRSEDSAKVRVAASLGPAKGYVDHIQALAIPEDVQRQSPAGRSVREGRCVVVNRFLEEPSTQPWHEAARKFGIAACIAIPLRRQGVACGVLILYANTEDVFDERIVDELGVLSQTLSYAIDAADERTARRIADARLIENQRTLEAILDAVQQSILMLTPEGEVLAINREGATRIGMKPEDIVGCNLGNLVSPEMATSRGDMVRNALGSGSPVVFQEESKGRFLKTTLYPVLNGAQRIVVYSEDITAQVIAGREAAALREKELRQGRRWLALLRQTLEVENEANWDECVFLSRALLQAKRLTNSRSGGLCLVDADQVHGSLTSVVGASAFPGCRQGSVLALADAGAWANSFHQRRGVLCNHLRKAPDGSAGPYHLISVPVVDGERISAIVWVEGKAQAYDQDDLDFLQILAADAWRIVQGKRTVKELRKALQVVEESLEAQRALNQKLESAQNQLLQSEKMASIGQLAAGVAHEINNPVGFVNSNLGSLSAYLSDIFKICDVCDAISVMSAQPEEFAPLAAAKRDADFDFIREDIVQLLNESRDGLDRVRKIVQDLKDFSRVGDTRWQWADLNQGIESTLNIVWNELKYTCTLTKQYSVLPMVYCLPSQLNQVFMNLLVNAGHAIEGRGEITISTEVYEHDSVRIVIADTGKGIAPENLSRIFDPFFTTKPVGSGTGLGLSLAWSIVARHQGRIEVDSEIGKGTTFAVILPIRPASTEMIDAAA